MNIIGGFLSGLGQGIAEQAIARSPGKKPLQQKHDEAMADLGQLFAKQRADRARKTRVDGLWSDAGSRNALRAAGLSDTDITDVEFGEEGGALITTRDGRRVAL